MKTYLIDAKRSALGRSHSDKGLYRNLRADELLAQLLAHTKNVVPVEVVEDVMIGCVGQHLEQGKNIARLATLLAGLPETIPGVTINRLCASSLQAFNFAARTIQSGGADVVLAGGVEHMHHVPMQAAIDYHQGLLEKFEFPFTNMGLTAERVAEQKKITRQKQDEFALQSHLRAIKAQANKTFEREILAVSAPILTDLAAAPAGPKVKESRTPDLNLAGQLVWMDQGPRSDTDLETLAALKTVFKENGTVTAGNSSPLSDGASLTWLASDRACGVHGLNPKAEVVDSVVIGLDPLTMGLGPIPAIRKLLSRNNLKIADIDLFEINEAFAAQAVACIEELQISPEKVNPFGGAIALGHPLGCTGTRLITTLLNGLETHDGEWGVASLCVGHGQGVATLVRRTSK